MYFFVLQVEIDDVANFRRFKRYIPRPWPEAASPVYRRNPFP
jgi:hypothetical protein